MSLNKTSRHCGLCNVVNLSRETEIHVNGHIRLGERLASLLLVAGKSVEYALLHRAGFRGPFSNTCPEFACHDMDKKLLETKVKVALDGI